MIKFHKLNLIIDFHILLYVKVICTMCVEFCNYFMYNHMGRHVINFLLISL